ncbi:(d)CMP kinase [Deinococcus hopiensis]|uniref:(d)CMP kinase n=1 Tax=Deinococcus hopiensis TaxID=309885 RepID=UPI001FE70EF0|nr:(d)CMP kinase [Deinococcus hopiensis]
MTAAQLPPGARVYFPRGSALNVLRCKGDEFVLDGPAGTGKSRVCLEKLNALAEKYPGCRLAIVRKFKAALTETALVTFEQHVKPRCDITNQ